MPSLTIVNIWQYKFERRGGRTRRIEQSNCRQHRSYSLCARSAWIALRASERSGAHRCIDDGYATRLRDRQLFSVARIVGNGEITVKSCDDCPIGLRYDTNRWFIWFLFFSVAAIICVFVGYQWRYADYQPTISSVRHLCCRVIVSAMRRISYLYRKCSLPIRLSFCVNYVSFLIHTDCQRIKLDEKIAKRSTLIVQTTKEAVNYADEQTRLEGLKFERHLFRSTFTTVCTFNFDDIIYTFFKEWSTRMNVDVCRETSIKMDIELVEILFDRQYRILFRERVILSKINDFLFGK